MAKVKKDAHGLVFEYLRRFCWLAQMAKYEKNIRDKTIREALISTMENFDKEEI